MTIFANVGYVIVECRPEKEITTPSGLLVPETSRENPNMLTGVVFSVISHPDFPVAFSTGNTVSFLKNSAVMFTQEQRTFYVLKVENVLFWENSL